MGTRLIGSWWIALVSTACCFGGGSGTASGTLSIVPHEAGTTAQAFQVTASSCYFNPANGELTLNPSEGAPYVSIQPAASDVAARDVPITPEWVRVNNSESPLAVPDLSAYSHCTTYAATMTRTSTDLVSGSVDVECPSLDGAGQYSVQGHLAFSNCAPL
jgi:hypothetical protein